jgi:hypothetical protein
MGEPGSENEDMFCLTAQKGSAVILSKYISNAETRKSLFIWDQQRLAKYTPIFKSLLLLRAVRASVNGNKHHHDYRSKIWNIYSTSVKSFLDEL